MQKLAFARRIVEPVVRIQNCLLDNVMFINKVTVFIQIRSPELEFQQNALPEAQLRQDLQDCNME